MNHEAMRDVKARKNFTTNHTNHHELLAPISPLFVCVPLVRVGVGSWFIILSGYRAACPPFMQPYRGISLWVTVTDYSLFFSKTT
jgi:hypothetical protein